MPWITKRFLGVRGVAAALIAAGFLAFLEGPFASYQDVYFRRDLWLRDSYFAAPALAWLWRLAPWGRVLAGTACWTRRRWGQRLALAWLGIEGVLACLTAASLWTPAGEFSMRNLRVIGMLTGELTIVILTMLVLSKIPLSQSAFPKS